MNIESVGSGQFHSFTQNHTENSDETQWEIKDELNRDDIFRMYSEYAGSVYNYFFYSLGDKAAAEDLVSDVFVKIIEKSGCYDGRKGSLKVWLFAVARNILRDYLRVKRRVKPWLTLYETENTPSSEYTNPEKTAVLKIETLALKQALESLNKKSRSIVSLKYGAGLRNKDIAKLLGLTEKNVGVILCRALSKLKKELGDDFYE